MEVLEPLVIGDVGIQARNILHMLRVDKKHPLTHGTPGFDTQVTEHANLRDQWFQDALVEQPWTKPPALVPENWPNN
jgi:hypothetical protein